MFWIPLYVKSENLRFTSKHANLLNIKCLCSGLSDETRIDDLKYYNSGANVGNLEIDNGVSVTSDGDCIKITTSTSGEKYVRIPVNLTGNWEFECELAKIGEVNPLTFDLTNPHFWGAFNQTGSIVNLADSTQSSSVSIDVGQKLKCTYINGLFNVYANGNLIRGKSASINNAKIGWYTNQNRIQYIKNIKLREL